MLGGVRGEVNVGGKVERQKAEGRRLKAEG
jgi:hypothetical protein